ncbi:MAG: CDP-archaeol synthase [Candidatus Pacebacteria bacterium]|nr:CDP-archaeol synthase [Candidatus Paceibacterota bacterium]
MLFTLLQALYFFLPAYVANMAPVFAHAFQLPLGNPVSVRLFGDHKTVRGVLAGVVAALAVVAIQKVLFLYGYPLFKALSLLEYSGISVLLYGCAFGLGALGGDMAKSFFKRRLHREPGSPWVPFDQLDFVIGALLCVYPLFQLPMHFLVILLVTTPVLHLMANVLGYFLHLKKVWW